MSARILIVDDSLTVLHATAKILREAGHEVETASDIFVAPVIHRFQPDLILMDMHVGQQKGVVAIRALKKRPSYASIPIALYSSLPTEELGRLAEESGADGVVPKHASPAHLVAAVAQLLGRSKSDMRLAAG